MSMPARERRNSRLRGHFSVAEALGVVIAVALALAAIHEATRLWLRVTFVLTLVVLTVAFLGTLLRTRPHGAWVGFSVFGWECFLLFFVVHSYSGFHWIFDAPFDGLSDLVQKAPVPPSLPAGIDPAVLKGSGYMFLLEAANPKPDSNTIQLIKDYWAKNSLYTERAENTPWIARLVACLIFGFFGSLAGRILAARREPDRRGPGAASPN
jgi:hypothetical protein